MVLSSLPNPPNPPTVRRPVVPRGRRRRRCRRVKWWRRLSCRVARCRPGVPWSGGAPEDEGALTDTLQLEQGSMKREDTERELGRPTKFRQPQPTFFGAIHFCLREKTEGEKPKVYTQPRFCLCVQKFFSKKQNQKAKIRVLRHRCNSEEFD